MIGTTFHTNLAVGESSRGGIRYQGAGGEALGGAVWIGGGGLRLSNSTLSGNVARGGDGLANWGFEARPGEALGGGLVVEEFTDSPPPTVLLEFVTVTRNEAVGGSARQVLMGPPLPSAISAGGGLGVILSPIGPLPTNSPPVAWTSPLELAGVIVADNRSERNNDVSGTIRSLRRNLIGDPGSALGIEAHDLVGVDARLGPLADHGGFAPSHLPLPDSPALDAADPVNAPSVDQRGFPRPYGSGFDLGAIELGAQSSATFAIDAYTRLPDGRIRLSVNEQVGVECVVEFSEDLIDWEAWGTVAPGGTVEPPTDGPSGYYRLRRP